MIKVRLHGNLGNQLFQYSLALITAKRFSTCFVLEVFHYHYQLNIFKLFPHNLLRYSFARIIQRVVMSIIKHKNYLENNDCEIAITESDITNNTYFVGYFQNSKLYESYAPYLQSKLQVKSKFRRTYIKNYEEALLKNKSICISIRLGDYKDITYMNAPIIIPYDWYFKQLNSIADLKEYKIYIISDEIATVEKEFIFDKNLNVEYIKSDFVTQFLVLQHADICIISNSTFAWWGAFLNHKPNKKVLAPKNFLGHNVGIEFPKGIETSFFNWV